MRAAAAVVAALADLVVVVVVVGIDTNCLSSCSNERQLE